MSHSAQTKSENLHASLPVMRAWGGAAGGSGGVRERGGEIDMATADLATRVARVSRPVVVWVWGVCVRERVVCVCMCVWERVLQLHLLQCGTQLQCGIQLQCGTPFTVSPD